MRVLGVVWVGTRTDAFDATVAFFRDVLGVPMEVIGADFGWSRMPNSSQLEVFGAADDAHRHFTTGPVPEFLVADLSAALEELRAAGIEIVGEPHLDGSDGWLHFRAPDGNVYGLTAAPTYDRPDLPGRPATMAWKLEVVVLPVSDVDRAKAFYVDRLGFHLDVDHQASETFRVVQVTPPGSACSVTFGIGMPNQAEPGMYSGLHLVVNDIEAAHRQLVAAGVDVSGPFHFGPEGQTPGLHPERAKFGTYLSFSDPDGNGWLVQEVPSY